MIVISCKIPEIEKILLKVFQKYAPEGTYCLPESEQAQQATTAACWFPDIEQLKQLPQLKVIHSIAAGIEHLDLNLIDPSYLVCRVIDEQHQKGMFEYLLWAVLYYQRQFDRAINQQKQQLWKQYRQFSCQDIQIGVMGLGHMGGYVATHFAQMGYQVSGWARSKKNLHRVQSFAGNEELDGFLAKSQILINLLPLTAQNHSILSAQVLKKLPEQACVINCGRGQHLVLPDLVAALDSGHLRVAVLDVFEREPLEQADPLWTHEKVLITPHVASHAPMSIVVEQILENDRRYKEHEPLNHQIDSARGY